MLISSFAVTGNAPKKTLLRALGPSLTVSGTPIPGRLENPTLDLRDGNGALLAVNDNWKDDQEAEIIATGQTPPDELESAIVRAMGPGQYSAIVQGSNGTIGVGKAEIIGLETTIDSQLANISSLALAETGDNAIVGGFVIEGMQSQNVIIRGLGPSLAATVPGALADPTLELRDGNGTLSVVNNDWQDDQAQAAAIAAASLAPSDTRESAIAATLAPGSYTAVLAGLCNEIGAGLVEVYNLGLAGNAPEIPPSNPLPTCSPTPTPPRGVNMSTRGRVETGENVLIGGFIITGQSPRKVIVRGIGPSLTAASPPVPDALADPVLTLHPSDGSTLAANDNWKDSHRLEIEATGIPPGNNLESAIVTTLSPGNYTAVVSGKNQTSGVGRLDIYDLDHAVDSRLANLSTRGVVRTADNVLIGGFILDGSNVNRDVVVRAIGPSLRRAGVVNPLGDPILALHNGNGTPLQTNDDWKNAPNAPDIKASGLAPIDNRESAILMNLSPGGYTAIVADENENIGVGLVEIYLK